MGYNPADKYVTPTGIGVFDRIFGGRSDGGPYDKKDGVANPGGIFGSDPFGTTQWAWNRQIHGDGIADPTSQLLGGIKDSTDRFFGNPATGQHGWDDRWQQWFGTGGVDPRSGAKTLSPAQLAGLRATQTDYGARNADGSVRGPAGGDIFQGFTWNQNQLANNPLLDPNQNVEGFRSIMAGSPYDMPNVGDYTGSMRGAIGGPGDTDQYGQRGVAQTNALADTNIRQLMRGIDREAQLTLADQLPEIQQSMEAMGLGRSGAGQAAMLGSMRSIMGQANRDKQRTMADYQDREANRQAAAINLGSQIGAQGQQQYANLMGQSAMGGLGDLFRANQSMRENEMGLYGQGINNANQRYGWDTANYLQALDAGGRYQLGALDAERMGQSQGLQDWSSLINGREQWRSNGLNEMLGLADRGRAIEQERINQMIQAGYLPLNLMQTITTGVQGNSGSNGGQTAPWWNGAAQGVASGVGEGAGNWFGKWIGNLG